MGNPSIFYTRALQRLSHALAFDESVKLARELNKEESDERLEAFIKNKMQKMSIKDFYYLAGRATQCVFDEAEQEGCDAFNASCGGIDMFEYFIGIEDAEDETYD